MKVTYFLMLRNFRILLNDIHLNLAIFKALASNLGVLGLGAGLWPSTLIIILVIYIFVSAFIILRYI
jgi:hypothetical protein